MAGKKPQLNYTYIGVGAAIILIILLIIFWPSGKAPEETQEKGTDTINNNQAPEDLAETNKEPEVVEVKEVPKNLEFEDATVCEDYVMAQGQTITVGGHKIKIVKIGNSAVRLTVDGKEAILNEGEVLRTDIKVELSEGKIMYWAEDDSENSVEVRVGCKTGEDPFDKYVRDRGHTICESLKKQVESVCETGFDID